MGKKLENLKWRPAWVSHLGCIKGCLEYLNSDVSFPWLFGGTGHAFIINMHEVVCPSGPTAWNTETVRELGNNIGYTSDYIFGVKTNDDFAEVQKRAWEMVKGAIGADLPCYGWELEVPEYYVVCGYDETGYYYWGPPCEGKPKGPKPWQELGKSDIGVVEMFSISLSRPADDATTVKEALAFALKHAESPSEWIFPKYKAGLDGFDLWIKAVEDGKAHAFGMAYNAAVWHECREFAHQFLAEAKGRIGKEGPLFDESAGHYKDVARELKTVTDLFAFLGTTDEEKQKNIKDGERCGAALAALKNARAAEEKGVDTLERIVKAL